MGGSLVSTDGAGATVASLRYKPFGEARTSNGTLGTDRKFTGQRLDGTGLYFYNARYYDPQIGRFVSPDSVVPRLRDPQGLSRYSYVVNNPLKYTDPTGLHHRPEDEAKVRKAEQEAYDLSQQGEAPPPQTLLIINGLGAQIEFEHQQFVAADIAAQGGIQPAVSQLLDDARPSTSDRQPEFNLVLTPLETLEALVPALAGTAVAGVLIFAYPPAIAAGPIGWFVALPITATTQVSVFVGGWSVTIAIYSESVIPQWEGLFS
ncbi:MAG: RHS repeat-associated core domain-containing protein [Chloroflexi bacterium]|nr:RHS repeat-associated core domain-containing protein [Chloroflexota bacterium]